MQKVLIITPHFPPINAPDHQRVRMALPYFKKFGWNARVLVTEPEGVEGVLDPALLKTLPADIAVDYVKVLSPRLTRKFGFGSLAWRSLLPMYKQSCKLLKREKFDLIYFSTTMFPVLLLGPMLCRKFGVPYCVDFQDPWRSDYYKNKKMSVTRPGGILRYTVAQILARILEPIALHGVKQITSVSDSYPTVLQNRYSFISDDICSVLPFGAPTKDFEVLDKLKITQKEFDPNDGNVHWVYVGRGGSDMEQSVASLFKSISEKLKEERSTWSSLRLHFIGTSYAPEGKAVKSIETIAAKFGLLEIVRERSTRIPYFEALQTLRDSDCILIIGSDDSSYSPSKVYPCILAKKPLLAIIHQNSLVVDILRQTNAGIVCEFGETTPNSKLEQKVSDGVERIFRCENQATNDINWNAFQPYTAEAMTEKLCRVFNLATQ